MNQQMATLFSGQWVGVKFYNTSKNLPHGDRLSNVRFCEATRVAVLRPVILDESSVICPGARYAFGWESDIPDDIITDCLGKHGIDASVFKKLISKLPRLENPVQCIGLNTDKNPDLILSYLLPRDVMNIIKMFMIEYENCLDVSLCSMMAICGNVAVKTYLEGKITFSFGCDDSRTYAHIGKDRIAVGIPAGLFHLFSDISNIE